MDLTIIKSDKQHRQYLAEAERLMVDDPKPGTPGGDRLELLAVLIDRFEAQRYPFAEPDPVSVLRFRMEQLGLRQKDLAPLVGGKSRVSEVLSGKRPLTVTMIRALSVALRIPAELLIGSAPRKAAGQLREKHAGYRVRRR